MLDLLQNPFLSIIPKIQRKHFFLQKPYLDKLFLEKNVFIWILEILTEEVLQEVLYILPLFSQTTNPAH